MTWQEDVASVLKHHKEKQIENGAGTRGRPKKFGKKGWSIRDTAESLKISYGAACISIALAKAIEAGDKIGSFKDKQKAVDALKRRR